MTRTETAFLVAPLVAPAIFVPYFATDWSLRWVAAIAIIGTIFSYLGAFAVGIPIYRYLRSNGWVSLWQSIGAGVVAGCFLWVVFMVLLGSGLGTDFSRAVDGAVASLGDIKFAWRPCVAGAAYGLIFWLIARPDRTAA